MIDQNISKLLIVSLILLIVTVLFGSLIRNFSLINDYINLPIKDYTITTLLIGSLIFLVNHFYLQKLKIQNRVINLIIIWSVSSLILIFLINFADLEIFYKWAPFRFQIYKSINTHVGALIVTLFIFYLQFFNKKINFISRKYNYFFLLFISIYLSVFLIINEFHRYNQNALNFQVVINPIIQVYLGKSSFLHFPSMYGHYGEFIGLILKLFNLNILTITIMLSLIFFVSLISNGYFLTKIIKHNLLIPIGFIFYIYLNVFSSSIWPAELYYQYLPIRTFLPSLIILFSFLYFTSPSKKKLYSIYVILSFGVYWNIDVGFICILSFLFTKIIINFYHDLNKEFFLKSIFKEIFLSITIFVVVSFIIFIYVKLSYGSFPVLDLLMPSQKSYLRDVSKLQPSGLWILTIFIYIFSLFYSLSQIKNKQNPTNKSILLLSLLGIGLFSYHANQHYPQVLAHVFYPSLFLIIIYLDKLFIILKIKKKENQIKKSQNIFFNPLLYICVLILYFSNFIFVSFFLNLNNNLVKNHVKIYDFYIGKKDKVLWEVEGSNGDKSIYHIKINELEKKITPRWLNLYNKIQNFINSNYKINDQILILSMWDSYLHMKLQIPQSLNFVNSAHLLVGNRDDYIVNEINNKKIKWIFFDNDIYLMKLYLKEEELKKIKNAIDDNYNLIKTIKMDKTWWNGWKDSELIILKNNSG